jgi:hypothetical protein
MIMEQHGTGPGRALIDLTLAASYAPGIICVGKSAVLLAICYMLSNILWMALTERCVIICILLYLDRAHHKEYIIDTNACVSVSFFGIAVNELRRGSVFSFDMWWCALIFNVLWCIYSFLVLHVGEACIGATVGVVVKYLCDRVVLCCRALYAMATPNHANKEQLPCDRQSFDSKQDTPYDKNSQGRKQKDTHFIPLLITAILLYMVCNVPIVMVLQDEIETLIRVFCFVSTSLLWLYTLNAEQMHSNSISSFTPCINRFMVLLLIGPVFLMVVIYILMISMVLYRGWDRLTNAVVSASSVGPTAKLPEQHHDKRDCGASLGPVDVAVGLGQHAYHDVRHDASLDARSQKLPSFGKTVSIIGMPSTMQYPESDDMFDPEAVFAEAAKSNAVHRALAEKSKN